MMQDFKPIRVVGQDSLGAIYDERDVTDSICDMIKNENYFKGKWADMSRDFGVAAKKVDKAQDHLSSVIRKLGDTEEEIINKTKIVSGKVRDATQRLSDGINKIEKTANFDRLERYVVLLERAEKAMSALAELDKSGKLEKIANALK